MPDTDLTSEAFHRFMEGFSAWALRAAYASDTANWVEALVLQVGLIDAMLRVGVILKRQLVAGNDQIDLKLVYQDEETGYYSERQVYRMAVDEGVIDKPLFDSLNDAYDRRNRAIHRLFLAEVTYRDLRYLSEKKRKRGHPLAGRSRSTDVSREKNFLLFPFFSSRTVRDLSVTRPCFLFIRCRTLVRTSLRLRRISLGLNLFRFKALEDF